MCIRDRDNKQGTTTSKMAERTPKEVEMMSKMLDMMREWNKELREDRLKREEKESNQSLKKELGDQLDNINKKPEEDIKERRKRKRENFEF